MRSRVEVYPLNEVKLSKEVLTQRVNFNPAPQKIEDLLGNSVFSELHYTPGYVQFLLRQTICDESVHPTLHPLECCTTVILASTGAAGSKQWDRMGTFTQTGETLHGRLVYKHQHRHQHIFYIYGEFDGWLVGRYRSCCPGL